MPLQAPLSFRWPAEFVARIDAARGDVPRSAFVRRAVERVLPAASPVVERAVAAAVDEMQTSGAAVRRSREELTRIRAEKLRRANRGEAW
jgi:hypothetical protein